MERAVTSLETKMLSQIDLLFQWSKAWLHLGMCPTQPLSKRNRFIQMPSSREHVEMAYPLLSHRRTPDWSGKGNSLDADRKAPGKTTKCK